MSTDAARRITGDVPAMLAPTSPSGRPTAVTSVGPGALAARPFDGGLLVAFLCLVGFGTVMVYSASIGVADMKIGDPSFYLRQHVKHVIVGLLALAVGMGIDYRVYRRYVYGILGAALALLGLVLALGITRGFSTRWIGVGGFEFQPSEGAKLAFIVYLAYSLEKKRERVRSFAIGFLPHVIVCGLLVALCLAQPDLGASILLAITMFVMLYVAGTRTSYIVAIFSIAAPLAATYIARSSHRMDRVLTWIDPWRDRYDTGFQVVNSLTSLGSGGWSGVGLGAGRQKMGFLTQSWTDFIFASIGEELGFVGCAAVAAAFLWIGWRGLRAARRAPDLFGTYLAFGITSLMTVQAAWNMAVAVGLLPTKGLNLPFVSGGGSSMLVTCFAAGVLLNVSRGGGRDPLAVKRKAPPARESQVRELPKVRRKPVAQRDSGVRAFVRPTDGGAA